jgi:hypothetical protein
MMPMAVFEALVNDEELNNCGINAGRIYEMQSINQDETPDATTHFLVIDMQESTTMSQTYAGMGNGIPKAPRVMDVACHISWDVSRDYKPINHILNQVDRVLTEFEQEIGTDNMRVTCIAKSGRGRNLQDDGWRTTTRHATYSVLYDESAA